MRRGAGRPPLSHTPAQGLLWHHETSSCEQERRRRAEYLTQEGSEKETRRWARRGGLYFRWRIFARMRRFFRPTLRRPLRFFISVTVIASSRDARHDCHRVPRAAGPR